MMLLGIEPLEVARILIGVMIGVVIGGFWADAVSGAFQTRRDLFFSAALTLNVTAFGIVAIAYLKSIG